jgi:hypothetical protein
MKNVYVVKLAKPVGMVPQGHHYAGKNTIWLHVLASSFAQAHEAVQRKYPGAQVRGIDLLNYDDIPIVVGE